MKFLLEKIDTYSILSARILQGRKKWKEKKQMTITISSNKYR